MFRILEHLSYLDALLDHQHIMMNVEGCDIFGAVRFHVFTLCSDLFVVLVQNVMMDKLIKFSFLV